MAKKIFLSCNKDFTLFMDFENYLKHFLPRDLYMDYLNKMSTKLERYPSKFMNYSQFIIDNIEDSDDINSN